MAKKYQLHRVPVARLKKWCRILLRESGDDVRRWKKERCVNELLGRPVEIRMKRGASGNMEVDEDEGDEEGALAARQQGEALETEDEDGEEE